MKKIILSGVQVFFAVFLISSCGKDEKETIKDIVTFEEVLLNDQGIYNGSDGSGGFTSGNIRFKTNYNSEYASWSGFAVSNHTDTLTADYTNQYSSIAGSGFQGSPKFAVLYSFSADTIEFIKPAKVTSLAITNSTYTYFTIRDGNDFSFPFGGIDGTSPDYYYLYITAIDVSGVSFKSDPIPLADFTTDDDEIIKEWATLNLSGAGYVKYLIFSFDSSDKGPWGINTPTYLCIDNIVNEWEE